MKNAIEIKNIHKSYNNFTLQDVSFSVPCGCIVGFVGENGSGKTTTIKAILDIIQLDSGSINIYGQPHNGDASVREHIGMVFDECYFNETLIAKEIGSIFQNIYKNWDEAYYQTLLEKFSLAHLTGKKDTIKTYSRGMRMKLSLAVAMAHHPSILLLDEATSGLDPIIRDEILDMMLEFIQNENNSILFSSHITSDIEKAADYLVFIHQGKIVVAEEKDLLLANYGVLRCSLDAVDTLPRDIIVGWRKSEFGASVLVSDRHALPLDENMRMDNASIEDLMLYMIKGGHPQ